MTMQRKLLHPDRFIWDFWATWDESLGLFHLFYLNAPRPSRRGERYHHLARVGYAITADFTEIVWIEDDLLPPDPKGWDNRSIWSGDVVPCNGGWLMGYTSRDYRADDPMAQIVGFAFSPDLVRWERIPEWTLRPDAQWYETAATVDDNSIHGWRDPYFFVEEGVPKLILFGKSKSLPGARKACIAQAEFTGNGWVAGPPLLATGWYSEMDTPQLYLDREGNRCIFFSVGTKYDKAPKTDAQGGGQLIRICSKDNITPETAEKCPPEVIVPASSGLYAFRIIPELGGVVAGWDVQTGGWVLTDTYIPTLSLPQRRLPITP